MATEDELKRKLQRHVEKHLTLAQTYTLACPICKNETWDAMPPVLAPVMPQFQAATTATGRKVLRSLLPSTEAQAVPFGFIACQRCGYAHFFAWSTVEAGE